MCDSTSSGENPQRLFHKKKKKSLLFILRMMPISDNHMVEFDQITIWQRLILKCR